MQPSASNQRRVTLQFTYATRLTSPGISATSTNAVIGYRLQPAILAPPRPSHTTVTCYIQYYPHQRPSMRCHLIRTRPFVITVNGPLLPSLSSHKNCSVPSNSSSMHNPPSTHPSQTNSAHRTNTIQPSHSPLSNKQTIAHNTSNEQTNSPITLHITRKPTAQTPNQTTSPILMVHR